MKILLLHDLMPVAQLRRQLANQVFFFLKYRPETEAVLHAVGDPVDEALRAGDFDAIFLDVSLLCWRWAKPESALAALLRDYAWVATHPAVKLAFPQDDYDHQAVLDEWLAAWGVDVVFSPLSRFASVLYPKTALIGEVRPFLTGFVDEVDLAIADRGRMPIAERRLDIAYRARPLPPNFGELGRLKTRIAEIVAPAARRAGLAVDVSTDPADTIFGDDWLKFLGSARYVLGAPSGSSVIDARGEIGAAITAFTAAHPGASFDEISRACVPAEAGGHRMEAISPRVFETALVRACQILVRGEYGPLEPDRHYIALEPDFSNVEAVIAGLGDHERAQRIADDCFTLVTTAEELHYRHAAQEVERAILECWQKRGDTDSAQRLAMSQPISTPELVERVLRAEIGGRQELLGGLAGQLAAATSGDPIQVGRFNELGLVVADRWGRLADHASAETARAEAAGGRAAVAQQQLAAVQQQLASAEARVHELENASIARLARRMAKRLLWRLGLLQRT